MRVKIFLSNNPVVKLSFPQALTYVEYIHIIFKTIAENVPNTSGPGRTFPVNKVAQGMKKNKNELFRNMLDRRGMPHKI